MTVDSVQDTGPDPNETDHFDWTLLHSAILNDNLSTIMSLVDAGGDPDAENTHGDAPTIRYFDRAASDADLEGIVLRAVMNAGANPNRTAASGRAPLHFATEYGVLRRVASALVHAGADPNALDELGDLPLIEHLFMSLKASENREPTVAVVETLRLYLHSSDFRPVQPTSSHSC